MLAASAPPHEDVLSSASAVVTTDEEGQQSGSDVTNGHSDSLSSAGTLDSSSPEPIIPFPSPSPTSPSHPAPSTHHLNGHGALELTPKMPVDPSSDRETEEITPAGTTNDKLNLSNHTATLQPRSSHPTTDHHLKPKVNTEPPLQCPLCQEKCPGLVKMESHLLSAHKVTTEGMHKLLSMVDIPSEMDEVDTKPSNENIRPLNENIQPSTGNIQLSGNNVRSSGDHDLPSSDKSQSSSEKIRPSTENIQPSSETIQPSSKNAPEIGSHDMDTISPFEEASMSSLFTKLIKMELDVELLEERHNKLVEENQCVEVTSTVRDGDSEEMYRCQLCVQAFTSIDKMYAHQNELGHLEMKQTPRGPGYLCYRKGCNQYFRTTESLQTHFKNIHDTQEKPNSKVQFRCQLCTASFQTKASLDAHTLYHKVKRAIICSVCSKCFKSVERLKSHVQEDHGILGKTKIEDILKNIEDNFKCVTDSPECGQFFKDYLGFEYYVAHVGSDSKSKSTDKEKDPDSGNCVSAEQIVPLKNGSPLTSKELSEVQNIFQPTPTVENKKDLLENTLSGQVSALSDGQKAVEQQKIVSEKQIVGAGLQSIPIDQQEILSLPTKGLHDHPISLPDQETVKSPSLEDFLNKDSFALEKYKDPSRKFKCHKCKMGFTKKCYLVAHNKLVKHIPENVLAYYATERFQDPNRPYKCDLCKESFTQKNTLLGHFNSVSHLHKVNKANSEGTSSIMNNASTSKLLENTNQPKSLEPQIKPITTSSKNSAAASIPSQVKSNPTNKSGTDRGISKIGTDKGNSKSGVDRNASESKKQYRCDLCNTTFSQKSNLEVHYRSVSHQRHVIQLHELVMNGHTDINRKHFDKSESMMETQLQQMQMLMEMMQQQQLSAAGNQSLMLQTLPGLNSTPLLQNIPSHLAASSASLLSPTAALSSFANAAMANAHLFPDAQELAQMDGQSSKQIVKESKELANLMLLNRSGDKSSALNLKGLRENQEESKPKQRKMMEVTTSDGDISEKKKATDNVGYFSLGASQPALKIEISTNTCESPLLSAAKNSDHPSNPVLAASVPVTIIRPRGYMGRFKPPLHKSLLENFGFECVMQFNENTHSNRKDKTEEKEIKKTDKHEACEETVNKTADESAQSDETSLTVETPMEVDLPEINKSICLQCGHQFSSIFVLKTHEEEVHKIITPVNVVEEYAEKFREELEKRLPKTETELILTSQTAAISVSSVTTTSTVITSINTTTSTSTSTTDKVSVKPEMPPPPPPPPQIPTSYDMTQMIPILGMMSMPLNLMTLGMQSPLPGMSSTGLDLANSLPLNLGLMDHSQQQQSALAAQNQKRGRTRINDDQLKILRAHFDINNSPTEAQISLMSELCGLPQKVVKHWFRNTLFKERQRNKDSPYNFSNPPSTTIDLEEYEKTGKIPSTVVTTEPSEEDGNFVQGIKEEVTESDQSPEAHPQPLFLSDFLPNHDLEDRRDGDNRSNASTPSNVSSISSAPPTPGPMPCSTASLLDAQAIVLARETAAAQNAMNRRANRTRFTDYQVKSLQEYFEQNAYPKDDELERLSKSLNLNARVIVVWFQNARQKARKVYENQPSAENKDVTSGTSPQKSSCSNYLCKKCGAVFQRYFELLKHQKRSCLSENNNNKPLSAFTDDDSFSSSASMEDSGLTDSLNLSLNLSLNNHKDRTSPSMPAKLFCCDKCSLSFNQIETLQEHQKVHIVNADPFTSLSSVSAFGMLQSLAKQEEQTVITASSSMPSSPSLSSTSTPMSPSSSSYKRKIETSEDDYADDQPKDKRLRTTILPEQLDYLFQKYQLDSNPSRKQLEAISTDVGLKKRVVQVWFQNTRARERKGQYRSHQQLIHKRCPFCRALFRAKSALETHLVTKHPEEMAKGEINIDAIPDAVIESAQVAHSLPDTSASHDSISSGPDVSKLLSPSDVSPYLSFMSPVSLSLGFPPPLPTDPIQLSMQHLYEDAYKKYISELSGTSFPPLPSPVSGTSHAMDSHMTNPVRLTVPDEKPLSLSTSTPDDSGDAPLDLSVPVKPAKKPSVASSQGKSPVHVFSSSQNKDSTFLRSSSQAAAAKPSSHSSQDRTTSQSLHSTYKQFTSHSDKSARDNNMALSLNLSLNSSFSNNMTPLTPLSFMEKTSQESERKKSIIPKPSKPEKHSEFNDSQYHGESSSPASPVSASGIGTMQKRYRTQMTGLQVKVMKLLFVDYKTPTMGECELLGREIGLAKRVVQVWFQNARAKEKKLKLTMSKLPPNEMDYPKTAEECLLCHFKYSHKFTIQDHIFTKRHLDNIKAYLQTQSDSDRDVADLSGMSSLLCPPSKELDRKAWEKTSTSMSQQQLSQLQQGLNAAALGLSTGVPGVGSSFSLGSLPTMPQAGSNKVPHPEPSTRDKKKSDSKASSSNRSSNDGGGSNSSGSSSKKDSQQQPAQQPTAEQTAELAQMMALGGLLPGLDPSYLGYMGYPGLSSFLPGLAPMPLVPPSFLPGAEHMLAYDPMSFGTPLPLLQIPPQAIKTLTEQVQDPKCTRAHYTQDCKKLSDLKGMVGAKDAACFLEAFVDVGYICKKCQIVYPAREACLTHQHLVCYPSGDAGSKAMLKLEQLQYECRACGGDKFSTLAEAKTHCQKDSHKSKVSKLITRVLPPVSGSSLPSKKSDSVSSVFHPTSVLSGVEASPKPASTSAVHSLSNHTPTSVLSPALFKPSFSLSVSDPASSVLPKNSPKPPQPSSLFSVSEAAPVISDPPHVLHKPTGTSSGPSSSKSRSPGTTFPVSRKDIIAAIPFSVSPADLSENSRLPSDTDGTGSIVESLPPSSG